MGGQQQAESGKPTALVTGGAAGIGAAISLALLDCGYRVVVADINIEGGESMVRELRAGGGEVSFLPVDVSSAGSIADLYSALTARHGALSLVVNNAGIPMRRGALSNLSGDEWDRQIQLNLSSVFHSCRLAIPRMVDQGGAIINVASLSAVKARSGFSAYSAAKAGVVMLTRVLAQELAPNTRVNCVSPVSTDTALLKGLNPQGQSLDAYKDEMISGIPMGRLNDPTDVAQAVVFLASPGAAMITGHNLIVDGGAS